MTITYPLSMPSKGIAKIRWAAKNASSISASPYSGVQQVQTYNNQVLRGIMELPPMKIANGDEWVAFLEALNGLVGTFLFEDKTKSTPRGSASSTPGTPLVNGSGQTGNTLNVDGLPISTTSYLKVGDYFQLGSSSTSRIYRITEQVSTNSSGEAEFNFWPRLRQTPNDNDPLIVSACKGLFRLATTEPEWEQIAGDIYIFQPVPIVEALTGL